MSGRSIKRTAREVVDVRCPLARALDIWLASDEGMRATEGRTSGVYLENRLKAAFIAGWAARKATRRG